MARYEAGETLASIARSYDCSPPAISYIVSRSRARGVAPNAVGSRAVSSEPQLIKSHEIEAPAGESGAAEESSARMPVVLLGSTERSEEGPRVAVPPVAGAPRGEAIIPDTTSSGGSERFDGQAVPELGDVNERNDGGKARPPEANDGPAQDRRPQRTLHLAPHHDDPLAHHRPEGGNISDSRAGPDPAPDNRDHGPADGDGAERPPPSGNGSSRFVHEPHTSKEGGTFIDLDLRKRVQEDIAAFLTAFDAALNRDSSETRAELRQATDRLLRAGARTRIELERLEARVPLPPRNNERPTASAWRQR